LKHVGAVAYEFDNKDKEVYLPKCAKTVTHNIMKGNTMKGDTKAPKFMVGQVCLKYLK
jgi:hypothetical protein